MISYKLGHFKYVFICCLILMFILFACINLSHEKMIIADDVEEIIFSEESGFYNHEFDLLISSSSGEIYYTLDGSVPTKYSIKYESPIHISDASNNANIYSDRTDTSICYYSGFGESLEPGQYKFPYYYAFYKIPRYRVDKCTIVRAVIYYGDERYSKIKTASFFVNYDSKSGYDNINIISIVTDPDNLFGYENGIYVTGKTTDDFLADTNNSKNLWYFIPGNFSNKGKNYEREVSCQFFNTQHEIVLSQSCGIRIHGNLTRFINPKSFNMYAREEYNGKDYFLLNFFDNDYFPSSVILSHGGQDADSLLTDYLMQNLVKGLDFATLDFVPYILFLDGEYWGVYWLTEKYDKEYIRYHYNVDSENVIIIKNGGLSEGEEDDFKLYNDMIEFCSTMDMTDSSNYDKVCELIDVDSYINYFATMIYIAQCDDWPGNNEALWRCRKKGNGEYDDGKWRWMMFDLNSGGMVEEVINLDSIGMAMEKSPMFCNLMKNEKFRTMFLDRIIDLSENLFSNDNVEGIITEFRKLMDEPMKQNMKRFHGENSYYLYTDKIKSIESFFDGRYKKIKFIVEKYR